MATNNGFKVESGIQLLTRLSKKPGIENFYPTIFENGPEHSDIIELFSEENLGSLLCDIISELLLPIEFGGTEAEVLIISTDGNFDFEILMEYFKKKLNMKGNILELRLDMYNIDSIILKSLSKLHYVEVFDVTQFYITIQNLENVLLKNNKISMVIFDTLTAFYWSEQNVKLSKMDLYLKSLLKIITKVTKDYNVTILYTKPEYFISVREVNKTSSELENLDEIKYKIHLIYNSNGKYEVIVKIHNKEIKRHFILSEGFITWI